jgi:hypothetical protein
LGAAAHTNVPLRAGSIMHMFIRELTADAPDAALPGPEHLKRRQLRP